MIHTTRDDDSECECVCFKKHIRSLISIENVNREKNVNVFVSGSEGRCLRKNVKQA